MKFSKEFTSQMVSEWQGAYLDYSYLKSLLKDYQIFKEQNKINNHGSGGGPGGGADGLTRALSIYKPFGGLLTRSLSRIGSAIHRDNHHHHHHHEEDIEEQVILEVKSKEGSYQTKFMFSSDDGGEYELMFFKRLDDEFNKVNNFYKVKVEEVMKEAALLNKQMDALIAFRIKVHNPEGIMELHHDYDNQLVDMKAAEAHHIEGLMPSAFTPAATGHGAAEKAHMDAIEESDLSGRGYSDTVSEEGSSRGISDETSTSAEDSSVNDKTTVVNLTSISEEKPKQLRARRPTPLKVLDNVKINNTLETPRSTIKGILKMNNNQELSFGKDNLKKVEEQLKDAFIHFHHKLELLKSYSFVNLSAVFHIMKKYDKITGRNASKPYLHMVDNSYIGNSDDVTNIMERVEAAFIKHFSNSNHSKGMKILKPKVKRQKHRTSFSTGFFSGGSVALIVSLILLIRARNLIKSEGGAQYMETMFPLYSLFGFIIIHMLLFAGNIYFWRRYRVNYPFIFGLKKGKDLGYREILLLSAALSTLSLAAVLANLDMEMDGNTKDYKMFTELVPLALVSLVLLIMFCPFNIIYRSTRFYFLTRAIHCILAPLYKVSLPDMFFADQISSQAQALRSLEFYICYYGRGDFKTRRTTCKSNNVYSTFYFILAAIGFWWRFLQCARRYFEEKDRLQGYNALKYFSIIVAISIRTAYTKQPTMAWLVLAWISSIGAGVVATWWDIVIDWGLFQRNSKNRWLRDKLLVSHKSVYFAAIVSYILKQSLIINLHDVLDVRILCFCNKFILGMEYIWKICLARDCVGLTSVFSTQRSTNCHSSKYRDHSPWCMELLQIGKRALKQRGSLPCIQISTTSIQLRRR